MSISGRVLENLTTAVLVVDSEMRVRYVNPAAESLFEHSAGRLHGLHVRELIKGPDEFIEGLGHALRSGHPYSEREKRIMVTGDRPLTVTCTVTPLSDPEGIRLV